WLDGSHNANVPPTDKALITMVHFKFTYDSNRRIEQAMALKSHSRHGFKYLQYHRLLKEMERTGSEFLGPKTLRFSGTHDLERVGLMKWALGLVPGALKKLPHYPRRYQTSARCKILAS